MMFIYKYFINIFLLLFSSILLAQNTPADTLKVIYPKIYGLRIGVDLLSASRNIWDKDFKGVDIVADYRINHQWYAAAEAGFVNKKKDDDRIDYGTNGFYIRVGADKNFYTNWLNMNNMIYVGGRYGFAVFNQQLYSYALQIPGDYFPENNVTVNKDFNGLSAHWVELVIGTKAEIYKNIFLGLSFRLNGLIAQKQPQEFENLYIPGFGKKYSGLIGAQFNYTVSYLIPFKKTYKVKKF